MVKHSFIFNMKRDLIFFISPLYSFIFKRNLFEKKSSNTVKDKDEDPRDEAKKLETEAKNTTDSPEETDDGDGFGGFDEDF